MIRYLLNTYRFVTALAATLMLTGCADTLDRIFGNEVEFEEGEKVMFTTQLPNLASVSSRAYTPNTDLLKSYSTINKDYTLKVKMYEENVNDALGPCTYRPVPKDEDFDACGKLYATPEESEGEFYWNSNVKRYAFEATAGTTTLEADQSTQEKWLAQDKLHGYAFAPLLDDTKDGDDKSVDKINALNYHTNKEWGALNKAWFESTESGVMHKPEDFKHIPLFLQHERAWITIILKAGEGVKRDALRYATSEENIKMTINSFASGATTPFQIEKAWASEALVSYPKDKNGEAQENVSTTRYDAIVEPHNYGTKKDEEVIAKINLSNQNFSFYAGNDERYFSGHSEEDKKNADAAYDLQAGKHLTLEVTLSRESRKILITAWIEDWTEVATATICDDYGQNGDPVVITNKEELIAFLQTPGLNKQGSVGIIQPIELDLDAGGDWPSDWDLNATLNLAGCTLKTKHQLFKNISTSGNLVNGTVLVGDGAEVKYAIADYNEGTIERINVATSGENSTAKATVAGMVGWNSGTIYQSSSTLPVFATASPTVTGGQTSHQQTGYIGGIAAVSQARESTSMVVIDQCLVNASVNSSNTDVKGGGIVGYATGRVSNCTYEYGISLSQPVDKYKNIFADAGELRAYGNGWPTTAINQIGSSAGTNPNEYTKAQFDAVIDCQKELHDLLNDSQKNATGKNYRISKSFTVSSTNGEDNWTHGTVDENYAASVNNVSFNLDGNDKTITLTGTKEVTTTTGANPSEGTSTTYTTAPMLFNYVLGEIKNLTIYLEKPLVASPSVATTGDKSYNAADAIAPLAYAVYGTNARLTNIKVKAYHNEGNATEDAYVQSSTPAGLVVWAYGGATISNCKVKVPVRMWLPESIGEGSDAKHYAGGIVACAGIASITQSQYLGNNERALSKAATSTSAESSPNFYYGGIVGGTVMKGTEEPKLQIADCSSWYIALAPDDTNKSRRGAIIASTCYPGNDSSHTITNGMSNEKVSEGNWWQVSAKGAGEWAANLNEEKVIGKKNSVEPRYDQDFDRQ